MWARTQEWEEESASAQGSRRGNRGGKALPLPRVALLQQHLILPKGEQQRRLHQIDWY
jgi:hypothetical protein